MGERENGKKMTGENVFIIFHALSHCEGLALVLE